MENAQAVRAWVAGALGEAAVAQHFAALSTNLKAVAQFGIAPDRVFGFRDWVGGRYSLWSSVGLSVALAAGWDAFQAMLDGGRAMDCISATPVRRQPAGAAGAGRRSGTSMHWGIALSACSPMTSGCGASRPISSSWKWRATASRWRWTEQPVGHATCPVIFGEPGTDAQHSFMQLVHQGTRWSRWISCCRGARPRPAGGASHPRRQRLRPGRGAAARQDRGRGARRNGRQGHAARGIDAVAPHRVFTGDRPSTTILFRRLDAYHPGAADRAL